MALRSKPRRINQADLCVHGQFDLTHCPNLQDANVQSWLCWEN
jgi:hypothetical protein